MLFVPISLGEDLTLRKASLTAHGTHDDAVSL